jgi:hypothetical protein
MKTTFRIFKYHLIRLHFKMLGQKISLTHANFATKATIQEIDKFTENQQPVGKKADDKGRGTSQEQQVECNLKSYHDALKNIKDL